MINIVNGAASDFSSDAYVCFCDYRSRGFMASIMDRFRKNNRIIVKKQQSDGYKYKMLVYCSVGAKLTDYIEIYEMISESAVRHKISSLAIDYTSFGKWIFPDVMLKAIYSANEGFSENDLEVNILLGKYIDDIVDTDRIRQLQLFMVKMNGAVRDKNAVPLPFGMLPDRGIKYSRARISDIDKELSKRKQSFSEYLIELIGKREMSPSECYKRANVDRKLFSKIKTDTDYVPRKRTILAFAVALKLDLYDTEKLLNKGGYALSDNDKTDTIVAFFIKNGIYDVYEINEMLFYYGERVLGS